MHHEAGETLERARYSNSRADLDEHTFSSVDVDLEFASFVDRRIEQSKEALRSKSVSVEEILAACFYLMRDVRPCITDVSIHLAHHADVLIAVE